MKECKSWVVEKQGKGSEERPARPKNDGANLGGDEDLGAELLR